MEVFCPYLQSKGWISKSWDIAAFKSLGSNLMKVNNKLALTILSQPNLTSAHFGSDMIGTLTGNEDHITELANQGISICLKWKPYLKNRFK